MATYLVTGGAGFIGTNIVRELLQRGENVVVLDNFATGQRENLADVASDIKLIEGDIRDQKAVTEAFQGIDYVLHQAALRAVERSVDDPLETNDVNITGTLNVLLAARDAQVKRVIFASSSSVYGDVRGEKQVETMPPNPESPYGLSKLTGEYYCRLFNKLYDLPTVSLRYFNVFGPYQNPESKYSAVIPILVKRLLSGEAPDIHWDGEQNRDFTYVANVVQANLKAATSTAAKMGEVYNIGNGENTSVNELYITLQALLGTTVEPKRTAKRPGDVFRTFADIAKAKADLAYSPDISFTEGLERSLAWYKKNLS